MVSWIVPTVTGREAGLERALQYLEGRVDVELIILKDKPSCGAAWVEGANVSTGDYIYFAADDIAAHDGFIEAMQSSAAKGFHPAALVLLPDGSKQSCGGAAGDVCRGDCADGQFVEWSPTPFITRAQWEFIIKPHQEMLASLHYSSDRLISAILAKQGIPSVFCRDAVITHFNDPVGRLWTAGGDGARFEEYARSL